MLYLPELFYLQDEPKVDLEIAIEVTAVAVSRWCNHYEARLIAPLAKALNPTQQSGALPEDLAEREALVRHVVKWLLENSNPPDLFYLMLDDAPLPQRGKIAKFDHHDDTDCWTLNLSEAEFAELQRAWKDNGLPEDLFYPQGQQICIPYRGKSWTARLFRAVGAQKCYTPKQWQHAQENPSA